MKLLKRKPKNGHSGRYGNPNQFKLLLKNLFNQIWLVVIIEMFAWLAVAMVTQHSNQQIE